MRTEVSRACQLAVVALYSPAALRRRAAHGATAEPRRRDETPDLLKGRDGDEATVTYKEASKRGTKSVAVDDHRVLRWTHATWVYVPKIGVSDGIVRELYHRKHRAHWEQRLES